MGTLQYIYTYMCILLIWLLILKMVGVLIEVNVCAKHHVKSPKMSDVICPNQVQVMRWSDANILPPESELSV